MQLSEALEILTTTYRSLDSVAKGLPVDAKEVNDALAKAEVGSQEYVALSVLAKFNPYTQQVKTNEKKDDHTDQVE